MAKLYDEVHYETMDLVRELLRVPEDFSILLIQGGATMQFGMVAMNLLAQSETAAYVNSGHWAKLALKDAQIYGNTYVAWDGADDNYARTPAASEIVLQPDTQYLHITTNETIGGVRTYEWPDLGVPLVGDMSSDYMSRRIPWDLMDVAYGGAQKNIGPSGVALVIVRKIPAAGCQARVADPRLTIAPTVPVIPDSTRPRFSPFMWPEKY